VRKIFLTLALVFASVFVFPKSSYAKSGCCSWHDGVSHCDTSVGRYVCNDRTYSPSCTCSYIPPVTIKPITPKPITPPPVTPSPTPKITPAPTVKPTVTSAPRVEVQSSTKENQTGEVVALGIFAASVYGAIKWLGRKTTPTDKV
jgi:hypothetical protein